jgi:hypothetical protein
LNRSFHTGQPRHEQHGQIGIEAMSGAHHVDPPCAGHRKVRHDGIDLLDIDVLKKLACRAAVPDARHVVPGAFERAAKGTKEVVVVVDEQDAPWERRLCIAARAVYGPQRNGRKLRAAARLRGSHRLPFLWAGTRGPGFNDY